MLRETVRDKEPLVPVIETVWVPASTEDAPMVRNAKPAPNGLNERVVTLRRAERAAEETLVVRLTTPANLLRLAVETIAVIDEPC